MMNNTAKTTKDRELARAEDAADIAVAEARNDEPNIPFDVVVKNLRLREVL